MKQYHLVVCWLIFLGCSAHGLQAGTVDYSENSLVLPDPVIQRGLAWLWQQRDISFGFQDLTAKAVTVFQLANTTNWYTNDNEQSLLAVKQMEIELLVHLSRHHDSAAVPSEIAEYCLALSSLCRDSRQFHGHDLIGILTKHDLLLDWEFAVASLAVCTSGAHVRKRQLRRLLDATESHDNLSIETLSMVMLALNCIVHDHRNRNLQHYLVAPTKFLGKMQKPDGGFGGLKATAMAIQALQATDPSRHYWNSTAATAILRNTQQDDGSFGENKDIETVIAILLALGPRSLASIKDLDCHRGISDDFASLHLAELTLPLNITPSDHYQLEENKTAFEVVTVPSVPETEPPKWTTQLDGGKITVSYTLWMGNDESSVKSLNITADPGANFYFIMQLAAQIDKSFAFQATEWPNGHYIHTLAGVREEPMTYHYWLLYKLPNLPNMNTPPTNQFVAPLGVDALIVKSGEIYLFWYKKL